MRTTVHLSFPQIAALVDAAGWAVVPWSPLAGCTDVDRLADDAPEVDALVEAGLLVDEGGRRRANLFVETALAALAQPEVCVEVSVPASPPLVLCRAGSMVVAWFEHARGGAAFTDAIPMPDLLSLLDGLFGIDSDAPPEPVSPARLRADRSELELLLALGEWRRAHGEDPGFSRLVQVVDDGFLEGDSVDPEALEACLQGLMERGHVAVDGTRLVLCGEAAELLGGGLVYGFSVGQVRIAGGDIETGRVTVYASGGHALVVQEAGTGPAGEPAFDVWEASRAQLSALVLALTFAEGELAAVGRAITP